jgi:ribonucleotide monophosphatase NagD (HAD superfamily)
MADVRTSFTVLEDVTTQAGLPLHKVAQGDAITGKNAIAALIAKDPAGNLIYPVTNSQGELVVSTESSTASALLSEDGTSAGSLTDVDVVTLTLQNSMTYRELEAIVSCFRDAVFKIVHVDDAVTNILVPGVRCGAGSLNAILNFKTLEFVTGATGTQELKIIGKNLNVQATMDGVLSVKEIQ